ncbi:hypothetical protein COV12_00840 [Candidatus Woesearchaeota archaeon CG10_big_fil_rev_8_21_14_0_10_32_24]|nr:MAG: hypothetical protein COV12_00840 [Candidatus Woesearchaeota archaeon CG10_big_fil_rev_8_21_14_0_10_32_24]
MLSLFAKYKKTAWATTIFIAIVIFYISSLTFPVGGATNILSIIYHISAFFFFALFLFASSQPRKKEFVFVVFLIAIAYGITDEIHQFFVPGRSCSLFDFFLDSTGIIFASMIYLILKIKKEKS